MGRRYIEPPPFDLEQCYNDSTCFTPLVFILSPGSDPMDSLLKFCAAKDISMETLSLGQGQGPKAEALIAQGVVDGSCFRDCHLAVSWMTTLDRICEEFVTNASRRRGFQAVADVLPVSALPRRRAPERREDDQRTPEGPARNMISSFQNDPISDEDFFEGCARPAEWKKSLVGLAFSTPTQERRNFIRRLEHPVRFQRSGPEDFPSPAPHVPGRGWGGPAVGGASEDAGVPHRRVQLRRARHRRPRPPVPHVDPHRRERRTVPRQHHGR